MLGWEKVRIVTQLGSGPRGSSNRNVKHTSICQRWEGVKSLITWKHNQCTGSSAGIYTTAFKQLRGWGVTQVVMANDKWCYRKHGNKNPWNSNQECTQRDSKGRGLHKTLWLLMFQDLHFPGHSTSTYPLSCTHSLPQTHGTLQLKMTYVNQANYFGFDFQTTTTKNKSLLFIVDFIFFTVLVKE